MAKKQAEEAEKLAATHTPAPWEIDRTGRFYPPCVRWRGVVIAFLPDRAKQGHLHPENSAAEDEANARLLSAAPDLLAALKKMRATMYSDKSEESVLADAAIAKAEGE